MYNNAKRGLIMEILFAVLLSLILILGIILLVLQLKKKPTQTGGGVEAEDLQNLDREVEKTVKLIMSESMVKLTEKFGENTAKSQQNLSHFQSEVQEYLTKRIDALNKQLDDKIASLDKKVDDKLKEGFKGTSETMAEVRERLQVINEAQKQMEGLGKEVVSLKGILEGNQTRGQYGEYQLKMVLHNVFGDTIGCYEEQYTMKKVKDGDDVRADAVVFMPEPNKMIAIDSKFPFQDYKRLFDAETPEEKETLKKEFAAAVKKHITVIKDKYIIEGQTAPEALMFIPNDGVFAFIHHKLQDVVDYAREKKVIITSPSTLSPILVTINMVRIEAERAKNAQIISKQLAALGKQFELFGKEWDQLSTQIERAAKVREKLDTRVNRINSKFDSISGAEIEEITEVDPFDFESEDIE